MLCNSSVKIADEDCLDALILWWRRVAVHLRQHTLGHRVVHTVVAVLHVLLSQIRGLVGVRELMAERAGVASVAGALTTSVNAKWEMKGMIIL